MAQILSGSEVSTLIKNQISEDVNKIINQRKPHLTVLIVGDDPASHTYVNAKKKACEQVGFRSTIIQLAAESSLSECLAIIEKLNRDPEVDGILVQLPLPKPLDSRPVLLAIDPNKDVDGFHPINVGRLHMNEKTFIPCTPKGIMVLAKHYNIDFAGKRVVVLGRSSLVGRPIAQLLVNANATVTICHSKTKDIDDICRQSDVIIAAVGQPQFVKKDWVKKGAIVIDVGIHRTAEGKIIGDVDPEVMDVASYMTPVPKGIGPMTIAMLLENTFEAYHQHILEN